MHIIFVMLKRENLLQGTSVKIVLSPGAFIVFVDYTVYAVEATNEYLLVLANEYEVRFIINSGWCDFLLLGLGG